MKTKTYTPPTILESFQNTCEEFREKIALIASVSGKTSLEVYALWQRYSKECDWADQSALISEFIDWNKTALGLNDTDRAALQEAVR